MSAVVEPSQWAIGQFGDHAAEVMRHVVTGLARSQRAAREVQEAAEGAGAANKRPYGSMWDTRYNMVVEEFALAELPGYQPLRPKGASYSLATVNGRVLIPFRHATSLTKTIFDARLSNQIPRRVSRANGVNPAPTLFDESNDAGTASATAPEAAAVAGPTVAEVAAVAREAHLTVIYIAYVANADSDEVLAAWWGTPTSLEDDGSMTWLPESLDMSIAITTPAVGRRGDLRAVGGEATAGFAQGDLPRLAVTPRTMPADIPSSEAAESTPEAVDEDE
ncbi:hypothetical protein UK82_12695 [Frankia sp. ACN1ag]|nr:hypothetical protein UK82_12695 [Frankia sp. ACN1ag]